MYFSLFILSIAKYTSQVKTDTYFSLYYIFKDFLKPYNTFIKKLRYQNFMAILEMNHNLHTHWIIPVTAKTWGPIPYAKSTMSFWHSSSIFLGSSVLTLVPIPKQPLPLKPRAYTCPFFRIIRASLPAPPNTKVFWTFSLNSGGMKLRMGHVLKLIFLIHC